MCTIPSTASGVGLPVSQTTMPLGGCTLRKALCGITWSDISPLSPTVSQRETPFGAAFRDFFAIRR